ncbi:MAG: hypothetical protein H6909_01765 [Rickettsiaceae bacterium]|nr:hypothetical protein [Rickettsiaceae bacterium]
MKNMDRLEYKEIDDYFQQLLGMKAWGASLGVGSFVTIEFGKEVKEKASNKIHGEWHLWIWQHGMFYKNQQLILDSEDDKKKIRVGSQAKMKEKR